VGQRVVQHAEQPVVLPEAQTEHDNHHAGAEDQPVAQFVEVVDDAQTVVVADRPELHRHQVLAGVGLGDGVTLLGLLCGARRGGRGVEMLSVRALRNTALELLDALTDGAAEHRQALGTKDEQHENQDDEPVGQGTTKHGGCFCLFPWSIKRTGKDFGRASTATTHERHIWRGDVARPCWTLVSGATGDLGASPARRG
jgi:hypothetical protein